MIFNKLFQTPQISELTELEHLVPIEYWVPPGPSLKNLRIRQGDYEKLGLSKRMNTPKLVGDIIDNFLRICPNRLTIIFAVSISHSLHILDRLIGAGIKAAHIDGTTPKLTRDQILRDLQKGQYQVVVNCMVVTEGFDCPPVSCIILARPTKSLGLYIQMAGRGLRPFSGKDNCVIIDHAASVREHGKLDQNWDWTLDPQERIQDRQANQTDSEIKDIICPECSFLYSAEPECPQCGWKPEKKPESFDFEEGNLARLDDIGELIEQNFTTREKKKCYQELQSIREKRGHKKGWVYYQYLARFGQKPPWAWRDLPPLKPSEETNNFITWRNILHAKRKDIDKRAS